MLRLTIWLGLVFAILINIVIAQPESVGLCFPVLDWQAVVPQSLDELTSIPTNIDDVLVDFDLPSPARKDHQLQLFDTEIGFGLGIIQADQSAPTADTIGISFESPIYLHEITLWVPDAVLEQGTAQIIADTDSQVITYDFQSGVSTQQIPIEWETVTRLEIELTAPAILTELRSCPENGTPQVGTNIETTLTLDQDADANFDPQDQLTYTITIDHLAGRSIMDGELLIPIDPSIILNTTSVQSNSGLHELQADQLRINQLELREGDSFQLTFQVSAKAAADLVPSDVEMISITPQFTALDGGYEIAFDALETQLHGEVGWVANLTDTLLLDQDADGIADPNDKLGFTLELTNIGERYADDFDVTIPIDSNLVLDIDSITTDLIGLNASSEFEVQYSDAQLDVGQTTTIQWESFVRPANELEPRNVEQVTTQAEIAHANMQIVSDDNTTTTRNDATITMLGGEADLTVDLLLIADTGGIPYPGETVALQAVIRNAGEREAMDVSYVHPIDPNFLVDSTAITVNANLGLSDQSSTEQFQLQLERVPLDGEVIITYPIQIKPVGELVPADAKFIDIQATVRYDEQQIVSDNPETRALLDITTIPLGGEPFLDAILSAILIEDLNGNNILDPLDSLEIQVQITNQGDRPAIDYRYQHFLDPNTTLVMDSLTITDGELQTNALSPTMLDITLPPIPIDGTANLQYKLTAKAPNALVPADVDSVTNQGQLYAPNSVNPVAITTNPFTSVLYDAMVTTLGGEEELSATLTASLQGSVIEYTAIIRNDGTRDAVGLTYRADTGFNMRYVLGSVKVVGALVLDNASTEDFIALQEISSVPANGGEIIITYQLQTFGSDVFEHQGELYPARSPDAWRILTDNPTTPTVGDTTQLEIFP